MKNWLTWPTTHIDIIYSLPLDITEDSDFLPPPLQRTVEADLQL
jgi:hypothetical protein